MDISNHTGDTTCRDFDDLTREIEDKVNDISIHCEPTPLINKNPMPNKCYAVRFDFFVINLEGPSNNRALGEDAKAIKTAWSIESAKKLKTQNVAKTSAKNARRRKENPQAGKILILNEIGYWPADHDMLVEYYSEKKQVDMYVGMLKKWFHDFYLETTVNRGIWNC